MADRTGRAPSMGWRDGGLEEAVAIVAAMPEINAVLEHESARLAQNLVSAMLSANHESEVAAIANKATKEALCRSFLVGLQGSAEQIAKMRTALEPFAAFAEKAEAFVEARAKDSGSPILPSKDFRLADFQRARAALSGHRTDG